MTLVCVQAKGKFLGRFHRRRCSSVLKKGTHSLSDGCAFFGTKVSCFFVHGIPDFVCVIRVGGICREIDLKFNIFGIFVLRALRKKFRDDFVIGINKGVRHFSLALKDGIGVRGNGENFKVGVNRAARKFHTDAVGEIALRQALRKANAEQPFHHRILRQAGSQALNCAVRAAFPPQSRDILYGICRRA